MATSIVIVSFNTKKLLDDCIKSIYKTQKGVYEVIIVDNNSSDGSQDLQKYYPQTKWILNTENKGFGYANNQGVRFSQYENILLLNSDTILEMDILSELEDFMNINPTCAGISPNILYGDKQIQNTYGNYPTVLYYWLNAFGFLKFLPQKIQNKYAVGLPVTFEEIKEVPHILGVSMFLRKSVFNLVDGFDTNFFLYFEETDLCFRIKELGYSFYVIPQIYVLHLLSKSSPTNYFKIKHQLKSRIYYFQKRNSKLVWSLYLLSAIKLMLLSVFHADTKYLKLYPR